MNDNSVARVYAHNFNSFIDANVGDLWEVHNHRQGILARGIIIKKPDTISYPVCLTVMSFFCIPFREHRKDIWVIDYRNYQYYLISKVSE